MAATTFHSFPDLPGELRNQIWDDAANARPANAGGVHRFSIFYTGNIPSQLKNHTAATRENAFDTALGPPSAADAANPDPWNDPQSTYSIDAGLWTACRESRAAMLRRHGNEPSSMTLRVGNSGGEGRYITIDTERDLVLLDIQNVMTAGEHVDFWAISHERGRFSRLWGIKHVGLDFDPTWVGDELEDSRYFFQANPRQRNIPLVRWEAYQALIWIHKWRKESHRCFWLVDRGLTCWRAFEPPPSRFRTLPYFQGEGCRYTLPIQSYTPGNTDPIATSVTISSALCMTPQGWCWKDRSLLLLLLLLSYLTLCRVYLHPDLPRGI
ncbi:hypothetical protein CSOJ01_13405 [Colletotrichum sojae]|uniref:2EXR domain-containing protein n=1 Tax=Colletotrichum sojae TaxID=2175907 RepID=A0A8H6ISK9_9PEZI|nr:hypothetical protein CSOJ01_13405 [Colletotrichum sojae]